MSPTDQPVLQLRDIHLPPEPAWWPPAPGWWFVAALLAAMLVWLGYVALHHYRLHHQRRHLLTTLNALTRQHGDVTPETIAEISVLLRRLALMRFPHQQVAALTDEAWLRFLDHTGGNGDFCNGPGRVLATGPYQPSLPSGIDRVALSALLHEWIKKNTDR